MRVMGSLAALAAAAFVLGAGAGLLWKDPGLVLAQWAGDTQEVAWSEAPLPEPEAEVAASPEEAPYQTASAEPVRPLAPATAPPAPPRREPSRSQVASAASAPHATPPVSAAAPARAAAAPPVAATPPVSAAPPPRGVSVQVGAFAERRSADQLIARLESAGFPAYAVAADGGAWRVRVGPFGDRGGAERAAARLQREQKLPTWVLEENEGR